MKRQDERARVARIRRMQKRQSSGPRYDPAAERIRYAQFQADFRRRMDKAEREGEELARPVKRVVIATTVAIACLMVFYFVTHRLF